MHSGQRQEAEMIAGTMASLLERFAASEDGAIAVEYTMIVAVVSLSIIAFLEGYAEDLLRIFVAAATLLNSA